MKLSIRTLDQKTISLDLQDETQNVLQLKQRLVQLPEITQPVECLQLIYAGSIMQDELPLTNYNIVENKFIVLMSKKPPAQPERQKEQPAEAKQPKKETELKTETNTEGNKTTAQPATAEVVTPSIAPDEQRVRDLMNMGYEEQDVRAALRASFNHPERAIEYLITGLPAQTIPPPGAAAGPDGMPVDATERLQYLATSPRFAHLRDMVRQNPDLLDLLLQHLRETDPITFEAIRTHQGEFIAMLSGANQGDDAGLVSLSSDEEAAVERLMSLGFDRETVVQVYLACDKNEELSAILLFSQSDDDDDDDNNELNYE